MAMQPANRKASGFTLIEMLVVVSVLGILVSLAGHHNTRVLRKSKDASLMLELGSLRTAVHQYALDNMGRFPKNLEELKPDQIKNLPQRWQGSEGGGRYHYDALTGSIELYDETGSSPTSQQDFSGKSYAEY
jgi:prepilin-type N-terminal cleavage/methylation domain-containing protein